MTNYTLTATTIILRDDGAHIPADPMNRDYAEYLTWVAEGNTPAPYVAPPAAPLTATPYQFRAGLTAAGIRSQVDSMVSNGSQNIKDAYEYAALFSESDPIIIQIGTELNLTEAQIHNIFVEMQKLSA